MKRIIRAAIMLVLSGAILGSWQIGRGRLPELEDISAFDPSVYDTTYQLQTLKIKPNDKQWTLDSIQYFTSDGELENETVYQLDESGQSYYLTPGGKRISSVNLSCAYIIIASATRKKQLIRKSSIIKALKPKTLEESL